jgi:hypothetical protein
MIIKEKLMFVARTCHLPISITLYCKGIEHHGTDIVTGLTEQVGGR